MAPVFFLLSLLFVPFSQLHPESPQTCHEDALRKSFLEQDSVESFDNPEPMLGLIGQIAIPSDLFRMMDLCLGVSR